MGRTGGVIAEECRRRHRLPLTLLWLLTGPAGAGGAIGAGDACPEAVVRAAPARHVILVEGAGDVARRFYGPAFAAVRERRKEEVELVLVCADDSSFTASDPALAARQRDTWEALRALGVVVLDKAVARDRAEYAALAADTVVIANVPRAHVTSTLAALGRAHRPARIFIEKPLDADLTAARRLAAQQPPGDERLWAYDHYRARVPLDEGARELVAVHLGHRIERLTFYFLEDRSGSDPQLAARADRSADGAIEIEDRVAALDEGVVLDQLAHLFPLLRDFGALQSVAPSAVRTGRYLGVRGDPARAAEIRGETYAAVRFRWRDRWGNDAGGEAFVGKGVRGVRALGPEHEHNAKLLELVGANGRRVRFDLRSRGAGASSAELRDESGHVVAVLPLHPEPYAAFLETIATGGDASAVALSLAEGVRTLELLELIRSGTSASGASSSVVRSSFLYPGGMSPGPAMPGGRPAPWLEELEPEPGAAAAPTPAPAPEGHRAAG